MKRTLFFIMLAVITAGSVRAQSGTDRLSISTGLLYERGLDLTLSYEHETRHHTAWEFFVNGYVKWDECASCGHICPQSMWHGYRTWAVGAAWKPCVIRGRNSNGNLRLGASAGSDTHEAMGVFHVGYEHSYTLHHGLRLFWQVKTDLTLNAEDLLRSGAVIGLKIPLNK